MANKVQISKYHYGRTSQFRFNKYATITSSRHATHHLHTLDVSVRDAYDVKR